MSPLGCSGGLECSAPNSEKEVLDSCGSVFSTGNSMRKKGKPYLEGIEDLTSPVPLLSKCMSCLKDGSAVPRVRLISMCRRAGAVPAAQAER